MSKNNNNGFLKFLTGVLIGTGIGILFAPDEGKKTRRKLRENLDELLEKIGTITEEDIKKSINVQVNNIRKILNEIDKETIKEEFDKKSKIVREKIFKLVEYVRNNGEPVHEKVVNDIKKEVNKLLETKNEEFRK